MTIVHWAAVTVVAWILCGVVTCWLDKLAYWVDGKCKNSWRWLNYLTAGGRTSKKNVVLILWLGPFSLIIILVIYSGFIISVAWYKFCRFLHIISGYGNLD